MDQLRSATALAVDLDRLGVAAGDTVMVHASMRRIGPIEGGADGVVAAIDAAVGASGTWMMVLGARDDWSWVNDEPESVRAALLADAEPFDARTTPADPDVGVLAEVMRNAPGTSVSDHPEGRFGARGRNARAMVDDVPWDDYYGPGSPLARLVEAGGKVLRLGADLDTVTLVHFAEYLTPIEGKRRARRHRLVRASGGAVVRVVSCLDDSNGIVDVPGEDYFAVLLRAYLATGAASIGVVGAATSELIDAADLVRFATTWMADNLPIAPTAT
jgi:aminoglycoside N3'-acetyltransferase